MFSDETALRDLKSFLNRHGQFQIPGVALRLNPLTTAVTFYVAALAPQTLLDSTPTVLAAKSYRLDSGATLQAADTTVEPAASDPDSSHLQHRHNPTPAEVAVFEREALLERLARVVAGNEQALPLPPTEVGVAWAGVLPPVAGWVRAGTVASDSLQQVAAAGQETVATTLPEQPGAPVLAKLRADVWGQEMLPGVPAGAAFALHRMGLLQEAEPLYLEKTSRWVRLVGRYGSVVCRS